MIRVLSISTLYPNAHQPRFGTFVARQMEALSLREGWDVTIINPIGIPPVPMERYRERAKAAVTDVSDGVTIHRPRFTLIPKIGGPINPALIARAVLPLAKRLHALDPFNIVDAQFFYPDGPAAARVASELGLPLSIKARGADISFWGAKPYALRKMLGAAEQATGLLAVSESLAAEMAQKSFPAQKITVHHTGLDRARFRPLDRAECQTLLEERLGWNIPPNAPLLICVGALIPRKGQHFVLRALARLPEAHLALVGTGADLPMLRNLAQSAGLADRVHFLGSIDHDLLPMLLSAADAMVLPSESEGLANAWVEALACGCPLVVTEAGGIRELLTEPRFGRIVARDADAIAEAVADLLANPPPREDVAKAAARFSWEANAAALARYYETLAGAETQRA